MVKHIVFESEDHFLAIPTNLSDGMFIKPKAGTPGVDFELGPGDKLEDFKKISWFPLCD